MTDTPILEVSDVCFSYAPGLPDVLHGVNFSVRRGEFVAMLGQNGAGKTTLAKHFNGLHRATRGRVLVAGQPVQTQALADLARTVGYCYQNPDHQIFSSSVVKEVGFGPSNLGYPPDEVAAKVDSALELVGLSSLRDSNPFSLGRGQRQLVAVASILAMDPPMLVIDEPTTGMDRRGATAIMELLSRWAADGRSIIAITHDMDIVGEYIPRAVIMSSGRIIADGDTQAVLRDRAAMEAAHLMPPAPVTISDRLVGLGVRPARSIDDAVRQITRLREGEPHARRI